MILLIIIHLVSPPPLPMPRDMDGWPPSEVVTRGWPSSDELFPRYFSSPAFRVSQKPMPSLEQCEKFVARIPTEKGRLLYCADFGLKGFQ